MAQQSKTVAKILDAAQALFAEKGFAETSLRTITTDAGVNLAAVNYHFGSKKELIQATFARFLSPFHDQLEKAMDDLEATSNDMELEELLRIPLKLFIQSSVSSTDDLFVFMRLIGMAFAQSQGHLVRYQKEQYGDVFGRYQSLIVKLAPNLTKQELFWRTNFMLATLVFTMSSFTTLQAMAEREGSDFSSLDEMIEAIVNFMAAGLRQSSVA